MSALIYAGGTSNPLSSARCMRWQYVLRWRCGHSGSVGSLSKSIMSREAGVCGKGGRQAAGLVVVVSDHDSPNAWMQQHGGTLSNQR